MAVRCVPTSAGVETTQTKFRSTCERCGAIYCRIASSEAITSAALTMRANSPLRFDSVIA
ncbi:hypothetical protein CDS [Bradyrhizobium sp.]|nr:hypothetical protein CDS [Bradyrhizobium sp.]